MFMIEEVFKDTLKKNGLKLTRERLGLFRTIKDQKSPCSIAQISEMTSDKMSYTTVYRNLELFEEISITQRVYSGWKYGVELSDKFREHHHHMTCTNCETITSFKESSSFTQELKKLEQKHGFKSTSHSLELTGLCNSCS